MEKKKSSTKKTETPADEKQDKKGRYWGAVGYLDSLPPDWRDIIIKAGIKAAVSPLHDKDTYEDGENKGLPKKPHYHILLAWSTGSTTYENVRRFVQDELHSPIPQKIQSPQGMYRYFTHKDHPDKHQYSEKDIENLNGFNILDFVPIMRGESIAITKQVIRYIRDNDVTQYDDLVESFMEETDKENVFEYICGHTLFFRTFLQSRAYKKGVGAAWSEPRSGERIPPNIDPETGEVLT
jgi:hypothetical protein